MSRYIRLMKRFKNFKILFISLLMLTSFFIQSSDARTKRGEPKRDIHITISDNTIKAVEVEKYIESWYPRIRYGYKDKELWQITFPSIKNKKKLFGPTDVINGKMYFGYSSFIMELDTQKTQFTNRYQILGEITGIKSEGDKLLINTFNGIRGKVWDKESVIKATPEQLASVASYGTITNRDYEIIYTKRKDAEMLSTNMDKVYIRSLIDRKYPKEKLELIRQEYIDAIEIDPTNHWYYIYLGLINDALDKKVYSDIYYKKVLDVKGMVFYDYFQISTFFEYIGKKDLADKAFDKGMSDFLGRGYTPEQLTSMESVLNYTTWFVPTIEKQKNTDIDRTIVLMDRFYKLAPFKEGNYNIIDGVVKYLIDKGMLTEARDWQIKQDNAKGYFFPGDYSVIVADVALNIFIACMIAFIIFAITFFMADLTEFIEDEKHNRVSYKEFFKRRYISRSTIYSFVILYIFSLIALGFCTNSISVISKIVREPATINSGTWGNYATVKYFSKSLKASKEKNFFLAIANHQLKDYETAISLYKTVDTAESHNNIATIYLKQGKKVLAKEELEKALKLQFGMIEAKYNLFLISKNPKDKPYKVDKVDFMQKYSPTSPMIALPQEKYYRKAFYTRISLQDFNPINIIKFNSFLKGSGNSFVELSRWVVPVFIAFTLLMILMLLSIFIPQTKVTTINNSYIRRLIGLFVPGYSYNWRLLGPLIFAVWLGLGITNLFYFSYGLETSKPSMGILTTYALPDYSFLSPVRSFELAFGKEIAFVCAVLYIMIWLFNFFYILISRRFTSV